VTEGGIRAEQPHRIRPVAMGHSEIHQDDRGRLGAGEVNGLLAAPGDDDPAALEDKIFLVHPWQLVREN
jgi:hypothetical protein